MSAEVLAVVATVLGSGATCAGIAARAQRKSQFRERWPEPVRVSLFV